MKRILLFSLLVISSLFFGQQMISFESSEGYNLGSINDQQGWKSTLINAATPYYIDSQLVTSELSSDGSNSLKILKDQSFGPQEYSSIGGFYSFDTPISSTDFTVSFDVRINQQNENSSDFEFIGVTKGNDPKVVYYIIFKHEGYLSMVKNSMGNLQTVETSFHWNANTWYRLKIVGSADNISYYLNDEFVGTTPHLSNNPTVIHQLNFVHDNYGGAAYIDKIAINNEEALATQEVEVNDESLISIYPNPAITELYINSKDKIEAVKIYDMVGQLVLEDTKEVINISELKFGNYIVTIETNKGVFSEKFIKK